MGLDIVWRGAKSEFWAQKRRSTLTLRIPCDVFDLALVHLQMLAIRSGHLTIGMIDDEGVPWFWVLHMHWITWNKSRKTTNVGGRGRTPDLMHSNALSTCLGTIGPVIFVVIIWNNNNNIWKQIISGNFVRRFKWPNQGRTRLHLSPCTVAKGSFTYTYGQTSVATSLFFLKIFHRPWK